MFKVGRAYTKQIMVASICIAVAAIVIGGIGAASNLAGSLNDQPKNDQGVQTRVVQVGFINGVRVSVEQTQTMPRSDGLLGWSAGEWGFFAAAFGMLALAIATFWAVRLFFSPSEW